MSDSTSLIVIWTIANLSNSYVQNFNAYIDGWVQDCSNTIANVLQFCTKTSTCEITMMNYAVLTLLYSQGMSIVQKQSIAYD